MSVLTWSCSFHSLGVHTADIPSYMECLIDKKMHQNINQTKKAILVFIITKISHSIRGAQTFFSLYRQVWKMPFSPLSVYHLGLPMNSFTSSTILSATPFSSTTEDRGRLRLGNPNGRHSAPSAVYITVRPSSCFKASSRAARTQNRSLRPRDHLKKFSWWEIHSRCRHNTAEWRGNE